ncbi:3-isopropylmalate dehydratase [candidate division WOR-3 bacterium]|nr:3-isopropylmalate dehydratase [candidate division WOR-3 bacterium]
MKGRVWVFGDDIDTDQIYPGKYLPITDKNEMACHAMEGAEGGEEFIAHVKQNDLLVAGRNFGCGSSREHAAIALKGIGISVVIAQSFARIFRRNAVNTGLFLLESDEIGLLKKGDMIEVDPVGGTITESENKTVLHAQTVSALEMQIMEAGGLLSFLKTRYNK